VLAGAHIQIPFAAGIRVCGVASIAAARDRVANGEVDFVITFDLSRISRSLRAATDFVAQCARHNTRLIVFGDSFDLANEKWRQQLANFTADFGPTTTKGGA
jgi:hypothetical protein